MIGICKIVLGRLVQWWSYTRESHRGHWILLHHWCHPVPFRYTWLLCITVYLSIYRLNGSFYADGKWHPLQNNQREHGIDTAQNKNCINIDSSPKRWKYLRYLLPSVDQTPSRISSHYVFHPCLHAHSTQRNVHVDTTQQRRAHRFHNNVALGDNFLKFQCCERNPSLIVESSVCVYLQPHQQCGVLVCRDVERLYSEASELPKWGHHSGMASPKSNFAQSGRMPKGGPIHVWWCWNLLHLIHRQNFGKNDKNNHELEYHSISCSWLDVTRYLDRRFALSVCV